jgi:hypothetical protein
VNVLKEQLLKRLLRFLRDLFRDGHKLLGVLAPVLSVAFTFAKALNLTAGLRDISYAWALLPLLLWVFAAYIRRWLISCEWEEKNSGEVARQDRLAALSGVRQRGVQIRNASPASPKELDDWHDDSAAWIVEAYETAGLVSPTLRARLETLDEMRPAPDRVPVISPSQVRQAEVMSEVLRRIGEYLEKNQ